MIKNNIKSLFIHLSISFISILFFIMRISAGMPKWASEEAARSYYYSMIFFGTAIIAVGVLLYYISGRKFLVNLGSPIKNLLSTSLTGIISLFLWIVAYSIVLTSPEQSLLNSGFWQLYSIFNGYSLLLLNEARGVISSNPFIYLIFAFIPSLAMWIGLLRKEQ